jgi:hypothetical protein
MKSPVTLAALALTIVLAGCAPTGTATPTTDPQPTVTVTPEPAADPELVLGVDGIDLVDETGAVTSRAPMTDAAAVLALITAALGPSSGFESSEFGDSTDWGDAVSVISNPANFAFVNFFAPDAGGYDLVTSEGITVGSPVTDVQALEYYDEDFDGDGDGVSDILGLEPREEPGTDSLSHPGDVGTSYIAAFIQDGAVWRLGSPAGDWRDV